MSNQTQDRIQAIASRRAEAARMVDQLGIDWDTLPKLPFFDFDKERYKLYVAENIISGQQLLQRQFTVDERNAVAYHAAKKRVTLAFALPVSLGITVAAMRRGHDTYRFPFWTPKPTNFDPSRFPIPSSKAPFTLLEGARAVTAWHVARGLAYFTLIHTAVTAFVQVYATSVEVAGLSRDVRLRDMSKEIQQRSRNRRGGAAVPFPGRPVPPEDPSMRDSDAEFTNSQYGGYSMGEESRQGTETYDTATPMSSDYSTPRERQQTRRQQPQEPAATQSYSPPASDGLEGGGIFDDASPVAPAGRGRPGTSPSGLSRWDQIRRQAATGSGAAQAGTDGHHGDSFTYSQEDRDNATAKEQAQREFDAMLEKERQGETADRWRRN